MRAAALHTEHGDLHMQDGQHDEAAREYVRALDLLKHQSAEIQICAYLRLGHANQLRGRMVACVTCYRKALDLDPSHRAALRSLLNLHAEWHEWDYVRPLEERLFDALEGDPEQHDELLRSGDRWWKKAGDEVTARQRYTRVLAGFPTSAQAQVRLRALVGVPVNPVELMRRRVEDAHDDAALASAYLELGKHHLDHDDAHEALACFETAFTVNPLQIDALEIMLKVLVAQGDYARIERLWRTLPAGGAPHVLAARDAIREATAHLEPDAEDRTRKSAIRRRRKTWGWEERTPETRPSDPDRRTG